MYFWQVLGIFFTTSILATVTGLLFINFLSPDFHNSGRVHFRGGAADLGHTAVCGLVGAQQQLSFDMGLGEAERSGMRGEVASVVQHQGYVMNSVMGIGYRVVDFNIASLFYAPNILGMSLHYTASTEYCAGSLSHVYP